MVFAPSHTGLSPHSICFHRSIWDSVLSWDLQTTKLPSSKNLIWLKTPETHEEPHRRQTWDLPATDELSCQSQMAAELGESYMIVRKTQCLSRLINCCSKLMLLPSNCTANGKINWLYNLLPSQLLPLTLLTTLALFCYFSRLYIFFWYFHPL